jgi:hypothetical protein
MAAKKQIEAVRSELALTHTASPAKLGELATNVGSQTAQLVKASVPPPTTKPPAIVQKPTTPTPKLAVSPAQKAEVAIRSGVQQTAKATVVAVTKAANAKTTIQKVTTPTASGGTAPTAKKMV